MKILTFFGLIILAIIISGAYGILHNQISFTISNEYFTKFKFSQFQLQDVDLALRSKVALIGFVSCLWMGIIIGIIFGAVGLVHKKWMTMLNLSINSLFIVVITTFIIGLIGLTYGWFFASQNIADYNGWFFPNNLEKIQNYIAISYMHNFGYIGGILGIIFGIIYQFILRKRNL